MSVSVSSSGRSPERCRVDAASHPTRGDAARSHAAHRARRRRSRARPADGRSLFGVGLFPARRHGCTTRSAASTFQRGSPATRISHLAIESGEFWRTTRRPDDRAGNPRIRPKRGGPRGESRPRGGRGTRGASSGTGQTRISDAASSTSRAVMARSTVGSSSAELRIRTVSLGKRCSPTTSPWSRAVDPVTVR